MYNEMELGIGAANRDYHAMSRVVFALKRLSRDAEKKLYRGLLTPRRASLYRIEVKRSLRREATRTN